MFARLRQRIKAFRLSMRMKLVLSLLAIAFILLVSSAISVLEYSSMSDYVSDLIADNISSINAAQRLANVTNEYDLEILAVIGDEDNSRLPDFNQEEFVQKCDSLKTDLASDNMAHLADSVMYAYAAFMLTSMELPEVLESDFINSRDWYFDRLQIVYNRLNAYIQQLQEAIYNQLKENSRTFERGFYRSVIPGAVAVAVGMLLVFLLLFFILTYYVTPIYKMVRGMDNYRSDNAEYKYDFEGDDELKKLNDGVGDIISENRQLRARIKSLRARMKDRQ